MRNRLSTLLIRFHLLVLAIMRLLTALLLLGVLLAGCGQKGPLFLPGHAPPGYAEQPLERRQRDASGERTSDGPDRQVPDVD